MRSLITALFFSVIVNFNLNAQTIDFNSGKWIDLSHSYGEDTIYWPTSALFSKETVFEGVTDTGFYYTAYTVSTAEHGGTHLDAPIHFAEGRKSVEQLPITQLIGPAVVIDVSAQCAEDADYQVSSIDLVNWEEQHGQIGPGAIVLFNTGFASRWPHVESYLGTAVRGEDGVTRLHFPGIHPETARMLLNRGIKAVGLDTASIDYGQSSEYMTHRILFDADVPGLENLADLSGLPPRGTFLVALPMKIEGGSGAPLRVAAFVPETAD